MLGLYLVLVTLNRGLKYILSKTISIGDIQYHIKCSLSDYYSNRSLNRDVRPDF